jgi:capsular polysaccharide biosynthesis protein/MinD-like ATPase involved in chromosome partitioning or flagellar assembly
LVSSQSGGSTLQLGDYLRLAKRRWWAIALGLLVGLSAGYAFTVTRGQEFTSTASVLVSPVSTDGEVENGRTTGPVNLDTEAQLVRSSAVENKARDLLRTSISPEDLGESVKVTVPANTSVLNIAFTADSAAGAQQGAHAFAEAYLAVRGDTAKGDVAVQIKALQATIAQLGSQQKQLAGQIAALPADSPDRSAAQAKLNNINTQIDQANQRLVPLQTTPINPGSIINDAQLPDDASGPLGILAIASGLLLGLLFGLLLALAIERADKRVRRSVDLEREFDVPVLVEVPTGPRTDFSVVQSTHSRQGNAFSELRNVLVSLVSDREQIILVAGASDGPAGSIVAANLAVSLARMNLDTVLVCADPASSGRQILGLDPDAPGLSELLHGGLNVADLEQRPVTGHGLRVIPPGVEAELTSEATQVFLTEQAIRQFRHSARFVVIDAPPMSSGSQAQTLARLAHVTVLVVELGTTTHDQVLRAARLIDLVGTRSIGMVAMPRVPVRREKRGSAAKRPAASSGTTAAETRGLAPDRYRASATERPDRDRYDADRYSADRHSADRHSADRYGSDPYGSERYGTDRYQTDRAEDRYGATADDLAAAAGRPPITRPPGGHTNGTPAKANGTAANGTDASQSNGANGTPAGSVNGNGATPADPAVEAATDEPTRRITRPAVD